MNVFFCDDLITGIFRFGVFTYLKFFIANMYWRHWQLESFINQQLLHVEIDTNFIVCMSENTKIKCSTYATLDFDIKYFCRIKKPI